MWVVGVPNFYQWWRYIHPPPSLGSLWPQATEFMADEALQRKQRNHSSLSRKSGSKRGLRLYLTMVSKHTTLHPTCTSVQIIKIHPAQIAQGVSRSKVSGSSSEVKSRVHLCTTWEMHCCLQAHQWILVQRSPQWQHGLELVIIEMCNIVKALGFSWRSYR